MCIYRLGLILLVVFGFAKAVHADPIINPRTGPVQIQVGDLPQLQTMFSNLFGSSSALSAMNNQTNYATFQPTAQTTFTWLGSVAGYERSNVFGIYEALNPLIERTIFNRVDTTGAPNHHVGEIVTGAFSASAQLHQFGLFLDVYADDGDPSDLDYTVYTDDSRNPGQLPQMLVFFGSNQSFANKIGLDGVFNNYDIIIAIEDLNRRSGKTDDDFNDLVVLIENVQFGQNAPPPSFDISLPEPASMTLWGLFAALGGFFSWRRWKPAAARVAK